MGLSAIRILLFLLPFSIFATIVEHEPPSLLLAPNISQPLIYHNALKAISSLEHSPSCNRLAITSLIDSCRTLTDNDPNVALDNIKDTYAARLALCELDGAGISIPQQCFRLLPTTDKKRGLFTGFLPGTKNSEDESKDVGVKSKYVVVTPQTTSDCLNALSSTSQGWTSYSNARQNAMIICEAARVEIEKDELLDLYRSMTTTQAELFQTMAEATRQSEEHLEKQEKIFLVLTQKYQANAKMVAIHHDKANFLMSEVINQTEETVNTIHSLFSAAANFTVDTAKWMVEELEHTTKAAGALRDGVSEILSNVASSSKELANKQNEDLEASHAKITSGIRKFFEDFNGIYLPDLLSSISGLNKGLNVASESLSNVDERQSSIEAKIGEIEQSVSGIQDRLKSTEAAVQSYYEQQSQAFDDFNCHMEQVTLVATRLQDSLAAIEDGSLYSLVGMLDALKRWLLITAVSGAVALHSRAWAIRVLALIFAMDVLMPQMTKIFAFAKEAALDGYATKEASAVALLQSTRINRTLIAIASFAGFVTAAVVSRYRARRGKQGAGEKEGLSA